MLITKRLGFAVLAPFVLVTTAMSAPVTFAQASQANNTAQFTILNSGGLVSITGSGQDFFTYLVSGTPFGNTPVLANFSFNATSTQDGQCGTATCPNSDSFSEQGFSGSFQYTVASGAFAGGNLLSGTFNVDGIPQNSGGLLSETINGTGGSSGGTQTISNPSGIVMTSDFLSFASVNTETGSWAFSGLGPNFAVDPTATNNSKPLTAQSFIASNVATFSSESAPTSAPEPATMALIGSSLVGLGLFRRKRHAR